jgi:threonine dehydratase
LKEATIGIMESLLFQGSDSTPKDYMAKQRSPSDPMQNERGQVIAQSFLLPSAYPDVKTPSFERRIASIYSLLICFQYTRLILTSRVYDIVSETPLTRATIITNELKCNVMLKREDLQPTFGFEVRGAYNKVSHLDSEYRWKGLVAYSTGALQLCWSNDSSSMYVVGNHAEGVAFSSRHLRIPLNIVLPIDTPEFKRNNVLRLGAAVVISGTDSGAAMEEAQRMERMYGITHIPPLDDPYMIAGQGTVGMEILRQTSPEHLEAVFCGILDGTLIAGVGVYIKRLAPHVEISGVATNDSNPLVDSLVNRKPDLCSSGAAANAVGGETF